MAAEEVTVFDNVINEQTNSAFKLDKDMVVWGPRVYAWTAGTTGDSIVIPPTGMQVDTVSFDTACLDSGCWVVDITFTTGEDNFNVFYLPKTDNSPSDVINPNSGPWHDSEPADHDYDALNANNELPWTTWNRAPGSTFQPSSFPCGANAYNYDAMGGGLAISACCMIEFIEMYRPVSNFIPQITTTDSGVMDIYDACDAAAGEIVSFNAPGKSVAGYFEMPSAETQYSLYGTFAGMPLSNIQSIGLSYEEPQIRQYRARLRLDEVELRRYAGLFSGTVGVEHTVDTFIGLGNFKPTGSAALDSGATQVAIHLEKTDMFAVSTHGVNDYTFLDYVNMRLVEVLQEDTAFGESGGAMNERTNRTSRKDPAHFVQVTFTMGAQYTPMYPGTADAELIPLDSVRVGKGGDFEDETTQGTVFDACMEYTQPASADNVNFDTDTKALFDSRFNKVDPNKQKCAPEAVMCENPSTLPDSFVSFNIPLGIDWLPDEDNTLANNVFVHFVVTAEDKVARGTQLPPNSGEAPWQMKTTLFGSIPVVQGGRQIFCDSITAKTDLQDVVNATLMFGSGNSEEELTRLRIFEDIGSSVLEPRESVDFETTASIEAGLMTLILTGDPGYFEQAGTSGYGVQLEDVVTVHIMEQNAAMDAAGTVSKLVKDLLDTPGQDNFDSLASDAELRTRGYTLNGAFRFRINRATRKASLEPTDELLAYCPFNPPRPSLTNAFPTTCVTRRDVQGRNVYPTRAGADAATAIEVVSLEESDVSGNQAFMQTVVGDNDYGEQLGEEFARAIARRWGLNDRYTRAYWVNPGYEWTPTQTGGRSKFSISQKLFFFALIALDENFGGGARRRSLLSSATDAGTGVSSTSVGFRTDPATLVADILAIPVDQVTKWEVTVELTREQACMDRALMRTEVRAQLEAAFKASASNILNVQVVYAVVDMALEGCFGLVFRRDSQKSSATAVFDVLVAFSQSSAKINPTTLLAQPGIKSFDGVALPEVIVLDSSFDVDPASYTPAPEEEDAPLGLDWTIVYGIIGGVGAVVLLLLFFGVRYCQRGRWAKNKEAQEAEIVTVMYLRDVKADLADDMYGGGGGGGGGPEVLDEKLQYSDFGAPESPARRHSNDFENAFSSPSRESRGDMF